MMSLRACLLSLLTARSMTGYDLIKYFDASVDYLWHATHSQIYPELRRMEAEGLVEAEALPRGERGSKREYSITPQGRDLLTRWVTEVSPRTGPREPDYIKASLLELATPDEARAIFEALRDRHEGEERSYESMARRLEARSTDLMRARLREAPSEAHDAIVAYKVHVYRGLAARASTERAWADEGLALVDALCGELSTRAG